MNITVRLQTIVAQILRDYTTESLESIKSITVGSTDNAGEMEISILIKVVE